MMLRRLVMGTLLLITVLAVVDVKVGGPVVLGRYFEQIAAPMGPEAGPGGSTGPESLSGAESEARSCTVSDRSSVDARGISALIIKNGRGSVTVTGSPNDRIDVRYTLTVYADSEDTARKYADALRPELRTEESSSSLAIGQRALAYDSSLRGMRVDYVIAVPGNVSLNVQSALGLVQVTGVDAGVAVQSRFGRVAVSDVDGDVRLDCVSGQAEHPADLAGSPESGGNGADYAVSNVRGDVTAGTRFGSLNIQQVEGDIAVTSAYGSTRVQGVSGSTELHCSFGRVEIADVRGPVEADSRYGSISATGISNSAKIAASNGSIFVGLVRQTGGYKLDATALAGRITTNLPLRVARSEAEGKESLEGAVEAGKFEVSLSSRYGNISVAME